MSIVVAGCVLTGILSAADRDEAKEDAEGIAFFEKRVRPLLVAHCYSCHSAQAKNLQGGLWLDSRAGVLKGGESGPAIVPGKPEESLLINAVRYKDLQMPPKQKLKEAEIADLEKWIKIGAPDPRIAANSAKSGSDAPRTAEFWCFQPVKDYPVPAVKDTAWPQSPVDHFVQSRLEAMGMRAAPPADKRTLLRRVTYDLTGLPPTPVEVDAFLADDSPQAWPRVVDRLLDNKAYGERWGRHWLDVVRYADTAGDNSDYPIPQLYKYRNWVIDALNADMPYDEFIRQQLAGDLLPAASEPERYGKLIATGYLANSKRFGSYEDARYPWHLTIEDTIDNLGRTFLGLTINCCRCHDHKFDPLTNEDYYALYGFFQSTRYPWPGIELDKAQHDLVPLAPASEIEAGQKIRREKLAGFDATIDKLEAEEKANNGKLKEAETLSDEDEKKSQIEQATKRLGQLKQEIKNARKAREDFVRQPLPFDLAYAVAEGQHEGKKKIGNACIQIKGDPERQGPEVPRRFPTVLGGQQLPGDVSGSGRLQLASWIADPANPLTARVMVNRIWHYHFGRGLVPTPSDFGRQGTPPTHPELLDWLARRFVESGWSIKAMHRLLLLSSTYQMSGEDNEANAHIDTNNESLWRFPRQRLDAESIRDTILAVSGDLQREPGGPHPFPEQKTWDFTQHKPFKAVYESNLRSVYLMTQRIQRHPYLALFDGPDTNASTARRITSTTPLQALYFMNDPFIHDQSVRFARRLLADHSDDAGRVKQAYVMLFARPPEPDEMARALGYLQQVSVRNSNASDRESSGWESLVRALWMSNEFVYLN